MTRRRGAVTDAPIWQPTIESALGSGVVDRHPVAGGDIGRSVRVVLDDGRMLFVKTYPPSTTAEASPGPGESERQGLEWLADADAIRVARPLAAGRDWIAVEWIEQAPPASDHDESLGAGLARMHTRGAEGFGLARDNLLATLPQSNRRHDTWARFYAEERIARLAARADRAGLLPSGLRDRLARLGDEMERLVGPPEPPARLHGDLWRGNAMTDERGAPCLIDPAVYGGHREVDLAMMRLFGGFSPRVFDAYEQVHPLAAGWADRVPLYQVWPLLAHVCLFGRGWVGQLDEAVTAALEIA